MAKKMISEQQRVLTTEGLGNADAISAGKLGEDGIDFQFKGIRKETGKYGDFHMIDGVKDEEPIVIMFSSKKLATIVSDNLPVLMNANINLAGYGSGYEREYRITIQ